MTAAATCRTCGTDPREGARFCDACGSPIAPATERAEYKQVTVLFADVVRSMDIAADVGPERLREISGQLVDGASTGVRRYGGTVDKFAGDGILSVCCAPVAWQDHAVRAFHAALDIQEQGKAVAETAKRQVAVDLQMRV